jgi:hypothetical protein
MERICHHLEESRFTLLGDPEAPQASSSGK